MSTTNDPNSKNVVTPFDDEELAYFRNLINNKRDESEQELISLTRTLKELGENSSDDGAYSFHMADAGTDAQEREKTYVLMNRTKKFIKYLRCAPKN